MEGAIPPTPKGMGFLAQNFMKKILFLMLALLTMVTSSSAQYYQHSRSYEVVNPKSTNVSIGVGALINTGSSDYEFSKNYVLYDFAIGHFFSKTTGLTTRFQYGNCTGDVSSSIYTIGLELNNRLTDYYSDKPVDIELNIGLSYGHYNLSETGSNMGYVVPRISLPIIFNLTTDKALQFILEPSYQYFIQTEDKYWENEFGEYVGDKVKGNISGINLIGRLRMNF